MPFGRLMVQSPVEGLTALSTVEGLTEESLLSLSLLGAVACKAKAGAPCLPR